MSKYTERHVVLIKRDIELHSKELGRIVDEIAAAKKEKERVVADTLREKAQLDAVLNSKTDRVNLKIAEIQKLNDTKDSLIREIEGYSSEKLSLKAKVNLLTDLLNEAVAELSELPSNIYIEDLIRESKRVLEGIQKQTFSAKAELESAVNQSASEQAALANLLEEKNKLVEKIRILNAGEEAKRGELEKLHAELGKVQSRISTIEKRENDVSILERRVTPEYKNFYKTVRLEIKHLNEKQ